jgi:hypothetical protein
MKDMKAIKIFIIIWAVFGSVALVDASTTFSLTTSGIFSVSKSNFTQFSIQAKDITNPQDIAYWKVRFYCEKNMTLKLSLDGESVCGKAVKFDSLMKNTYSFIFDNDNSDIKKFSTKLKAYNQDGQWLHTTKKNFSWK